MPDLQLGQFIMPIYINCARVIGGFRILCRRSAKWEYRGIFLLLIVHADSLLSETTFMPCNPIASRYLTWQAIHASYSFTAKHVGSYFAFFLFRPDRYKQACLTCVLSLFGKLQFRHHYCCCSCWGIAPRAHPRVTLENRLATLPIVNVALPTARDSNEVARVR